MRKFWSEFKYWLFILLVLAILFELVASMILFRKYTSGGLATTQFAGRLFKKGAGQKMYELHKLARPDSSEEVNKMIADETFRSQQYAYEPWLMFRMANYYSNYVNINNFERKSVPDAFIKTGSKDTVDIYFFGGDNMYGYHLADHETIPSRFVEAYQKENPGKSVKVKNFGILHYYSKQELMLLSTLLFQGHRPDIVVFLDGLNDFYSSRMLFYDRPFFSYALQQSFEGKMFQKGTETFLDSTGQFYEDPAGIDPKKYNDELIVKYSNNIKMAADVCRNANIKCYFFCEPVPFYKNNKPVDQAYNGNFRRFEYIYPQLEKKKDSLVNFHFLGNITENEKQNGFIDNTSYLPAFSNKVARQILETVKNDLQ
jgi:hypothetical protein